MSASIPIGRDNDHGRSIDLSPATLLGTANWGGKKPRLPDGRRHYAWCEPRIVPLRALEADQAAKICNECDSDVCKRCRFLAATSCGSMGLDYPYVGAVMHRGIPPSLSERYQRDGRAGRAMPMPDDYTPWSMTVLSLDDYSYLRARVQCSRGKQFHLKELHESLLFHVSKTCWHLQLENMFGRPGVANTLGPCGSMCPVCTGERDELIREVDRVQLSALLNEKLWGTNVQLCPDFAKMIHDNREILFGMKKVKKSKSDFLVFTLIAAGLIECIDKPCSDKKWVTYVSLGRHSSNTGQSAMADDSKWELVATKSTE